MGHTETIRVNLTGWKNAAKGNTSIIKLLEQKNPGLKSRGRFKLCDLENQVSSQHLDLFIFKMRKLIGIVP